MQELANANSWPESAGLRIGAFEDQAELRESEQITVKRTFCGFPPKPPCTKASSFSSNSRSICN